MYSNKFISQQNAYFNSKVSNQTYRLHIRMTRTSHHSTDVTTKRAIFTFWLMAHLQFSPIKNFQCYVIIEYTYYVNTRMHVNTQVHINTYIQN